MAQPAARPGASSTAGGAAETEEAFEEDVVEPLEAGRKLALIFLELGPRLGKSPAAVEGAFWKADFLEEDGLELGMALDRDNVSGGDQIRERDKK